MEDGLRKMGIPLEFIVVDIKMKDERILIAASQKQLEYLARSFSWFMDGTFQVISWNFILNLTIKFLLSSSFPSIFALSSESINIV